MAFAYEQHGTLSCYVAKKCRCELCAAHWRNYMRLYAADRLAQRRTWERKYRATKRAMRRRAA